MSEPFAQVAAKAHRKFRKCEVLGPVVKQHGPCTLVPTQDVFPDLVRAVIAQLLSTAAARTIYKRLLVALDQKLTPTTLLALSTEALRGCGLSGAKVQAMRDIATLFKSSGGLGKQLLEGDEAFVRAMLLPIKGVGPWTVDMVMMFALGKPDVLPVGDLGIRAAVKDLYQLDALPNARQLTELAARWEPYRTVACWHLWKMRDPKP
jgi:DNA-3-methyladenine glycosylase II